MSGLILSVSGKAQRNSLSAGVMVQGFSNFDPSPTYTGATLAFENKLSKHFSAQFMTGAFPKKIEDHGERTYTRHLWSFQPEFRYYPSSVFKGFFLGGNFSYHRFKTSYSFDPSLRKMPDDVFAFGFSLGVQSAISQRIHWSLSAGGSLIPNPGAIGTGARYFFALSTGYLFREKEKKK